MLVPSRNGRETPDTVIGPCPLEVARFSRRTRCTIRITSALSSGRCEVVAHRQHRQLKEQLARIRPAVDVVEIARVQRLKPAPKRG
jgi:hypothetical protein